MLGTPRKLPRSRDDFAIARAVTQSDGVSQDELVGSPKHVGSGPETTSPRHDGRGAGRLRRRPKTTESEPPPVMQSSIKSTDAHGGCEHDACFSSMPVGSWATSPRGLFHSLMTARIPWSQRKMQGISRNQPSFANICLENISEFRCLRMNSLRRQSREFFCQRRELIRRAGNEQGIPRETDPPVPTLPMAQKYFRVVDTTTSTTLLCVYANTLGSSGPAAPRRRA